MKESKVVRMLVQEAKKMFEREVRFQGKKLLFEENEKIAEKSGEKEKNVCVKVLSPCLSIHVCIKHQEALKRAK